MANDLSEVSRKACHNCRRRRLKCDRAVPQCLKCIKSGQQCLGYHRLLRWETGVASRGKLAGVSYHEIDKRHVKQGNHQVILHSPPTEPLMQDLDAATRNYLHHFANYFCRNLVSYDHTQLNPFRELIPLTQKHPILLHIIVANSASWIHNASTSITAPSTGTPDVKCPAQPKYRDSSLTTQSKSQFDALGAKRQALHLLQLVLTGTIPLDVDVTMAVVLLFIELELVESGQGNWTHHIGGARRIINRLCGPETWSQTSVSTLRRCLISNCLVFDILGSSIASPLGLSPHHALPPGGLSLLQDAEGNHCSSFPVILLQLVQSGAQMYEFENTSSLENTSHAWKSQQAHQLLQTAISFDPLGWASAIQPRSPAPDLEQRTHVASAHRAAVCIYLSRLRNTHDKSPSTSQDLEPLVTEVIHNASYIRPTDALFTATTWPSFIAGAETADSTAQRWVVRRFYELWRVEPWGTIRGALGVLENIWAERSSQETSAQGNDIINGRGRSGDWIRDLRDRGVDWLII